MLQVEIPLNDAAEELLDLQCTVEHLICTRPSIQAPAAPLLGATVTYPPPTLLCLTADHALHALKCKPIGGAHLATLAETSAAEEGTTPHTLAAMSATTDIEERVAQILERESSQPLILSAPATNLSPMDTLELLLRATETLKKEYIVKVAKAR